MEDERGNKINIQLMRGPGASGYHITVSRVFATVAGFAAIAFLALNAFLAWGYFSLRADVSSGKAGRGGRPGKFVETRIRDLEDDISGLTGEMRKLRKLSEKVNGKIDTLFLDEYIEPLEPRKDDTSPRGSSMWPSLSDMGFRLASMRDEIEAQREFLLRVEKQIDVASNETDRVPQLPPLPRMIISSPIGMRVHPINGFWLFHAGVDLKAALGDPVYASGKGRVKISGLCGGYGNCIVIDHGNGYCTRYGHLDKLGVRAGQVVKKGEIVGLAGSTGYSTGPHLHFEMTYKGRLLDPIAFFNIDVSDSI